jgi:hypothetical protein
MFLIADQKWLLVAIFEKKMFYLHTPSLKIVLQIFGSSDFRIELCFVNIFSCQLFSQSCFHCKYIKNIKLIVSCQPSAR